MVVFITVIWIVLIVKLYVKFIDPIFISIFNVDVDAVQRRIYMLKFN